MECVSKEARNLKQYPSVRLRFPSERFSPNGFQQAFELPLWDMAALELYYFKRNMLQTPKMLALKIVKWIIA